MNASERFSQTVWSSVWGGSSSSSAGTGGGGALPSAGTKKSPPVVEVTVGGMIDLANDLDLGHCRTRWAKMSEAKWVEVMSAGLGGEEGGITRQCSRGVMFAEPVMKFSLRM